MSELTAIAGHLADCPNCHQEFTERLRSRRGSSALKFTLAPEFLFRHEHVDYEQLVSLAEGNLDSTDREIMDVHLNVCASCKEDVRSFLEFQEQIASEPGSSYVPVVREPTRQSPWVSWWRGLAWKPIYAAAVVLIGIALVIGVAFFLKRRTDNFQANQTPTRNLGAPGQTTDPDNRATNTPSPQATSNESPVERPNSMGAVVALNDQTRMVTVDKEGNITGLDDVPKPTRNQIAKVLLSERIGRPAILKDLAGQDSALRGPNSAQPFRLLSPARTVIVQDRPVFKWEKLPRAISYRVYVIDSAGHQVDRSDELTTESLEWVSRKPLKRGEVYAWAVTALVDGREVVAPGSAAPEMKFQLLPADRLRELNRLRRTDSHLALGVFYAREGMTAEAEREFQILIKENPRFTLAKKLLKEIQSWQRP